jgi:hypothetical protein
MYPKNLQYHQTDKESTISPNWQRIYNITKLTKNLQYHQIDKESTISPNWQRIAHERNYGGRQIHKQWKVVINLWCRLNNMSSDRLNRKVFAWADCISISNKCVKNCNFNIKKTFCQLNVGHFDDIGDYLLRSCA